MSVFRIHSVAICASAALLFQAPVAQAHVTLETRQAPVAGNYKAVLKVPHGCKGSPTVKIRVRIPEGLIGVKPQPKAGWKLDTIKGDYTSSYTLHGAEVKAGVKEIVWSGGPLPDEHYDEFMFISYLTDALKPNTTLHFPVVQECEEGVARWIDLPTEGQHAAHDHSDFPAPGLKLLPRK